MSSSSTGSTPILSNLLAPFFALGFWVMNEKIGVQFPVNYAGFTSLHDFDNVPFSNRYVP